VRKLCFFPCADGRFALQFEHPTIAGPTVGGWMNRAADAAAAAVAAPPPKAAAARSDSAKSFTMAEVEQHTTKDSCWFVVDGKVYDATPFLKEHPGELAPAGQWTRHVDVWWASGCTVAGSVSCRSTSDGSNPPCAPVGGADSILLVAGTDATDEFNAIHSAKVRLAAWPAGG
jgi:nitrate reductase (NAD(P)H)